MTRIHRSADCGNSPKNTFVQNFAISLEVGELSPEILSENVIWQRRDGDSLSGKDAVLAALANQTRPSALVIDHAIAHGKSGATNGEATLPGGQKRRFCYVLEFTNAKANGVAVIKSYA